MENWRLFSSTFELWLNISIPRCFYVCGNILLEMSIWTSWHLGDCNTWAVVVLLCPQVWLCCHLWMSGGCVLPWKRCTQTSPLKRVRPCPSGSTCLCDTGFTFAYRIRPFFFFWSNVYKRGINHWFYFFVTKMTFLKWILSVHWVVIK